METFSNYEHVKLIIPYPTLQNFGLLSIFLIITLLTRHKVDSKLLDRTQTDQLKGIAILLVVLGHLWVHVSSVRATPILGGYAVSLFFILSGFGLTISQSVKNKINSNYLLKRFRRVIIPYWLITAIILMADFLLLKKTYSFIELITTFAGFNLSRQLQQIDYTRWYITLILIYYIVYFLFNRYLDKITALLSILIFSLVLCVLKITNIFQLGAFEQIISFPVGCLIAFYYKSILNFFDKKRFELLIFFLFFLTSFVFFLPSHHPNMFIMIIFVGTKAANSLLFCFLLILLVGRIGKLGYASRFLAFCGFISYEVYLIHGPLLIKYNPVIKLFPSDYILISFTLFMSLVLILSYGINKALRPLVQKTIFQKSPVLL